MTSPIRVLLVDDHAMLRDALGRMLSCEKDIQVVGTAGSAEQAIQEIPGLRPAVVVLDIDMPGLNSFEAAQAIRDRHPEVRVAFLSAYFQDRYIEQALAAEAAAYVTKGEPFAAIADAIRAVARGEVYFSPDVQGRLVIDADGVRLARPGTTRAAQLTAREVEVLRHLARGLSVKEIALALHVAARTVDRHKENLMSKLDIHDRVELTRFAIREGFVEP